MEFTLHAAALHAPIPGLPFGKSGIVIHTYTHVRPLERAGGLVDEISQLQDGGVGAALLHAEKEITVALDHRAVCPFEPGRIAREPAEADVVALVKAHERSEAARAGPAGNDS